MAALSRQSVTSVKHWNDSLFSFTTTREKTLRFENGNFVMVGMEVEGRPLLRAYSIVSANYHNELEFFSIKVPDGPLTSKLQHIQVGDELLISNKPTGTLIIDHLLPGRHLYLLSTGTGLAPFISIIQDPETFERYEKVILCHGVRQASDLTYQNVIQRELPQNPYFGELVRERLVYYPTVTREPFSSQGRITDQMQSGKLFADVGLPPPDIQQDRFMVCGSPAMLKDTCRILDDWGFKESRHGIKAHYVIERAFAEA